MTLQEQLRQELKAAMKEKNSPKKDAIRMIMGEWGRLDQKEVSDEDVLKIIRKLIKSEKETLEKSGDETTSEYLSILESYLPQMAGEDDIRKWIQENIDFSRYKNKMQSMGDIMKHFGAAADGNRVRKILETL